jgi:hypothetical protein
MPDTSKDKTRSMKERALEELKVYWVITLYLWLFLGCFAVYRRLIAAEGAYEIGARMLTLTVAFVPFFAFYEMGRVLGMGKLAGMFFARLAADADPARPV